jgi:hypothetical protein
MTVTVNANQATYAGGSGVDTVTLTGKRDPWGPAPRLDISGAGRAR